MISELNLSRLIGARALIKLHGECHGVLTERGTGIARLRTFARRNILTCQDIALYLRLAFCA
jgi:hypothetical protein